MPTEFELGNTYFTVCDGNGDIVMEGKVENFTPKEIKLKEDKNNNMGKFDLEKHWEDFKNGKIAVNCKTKELSNEFINYCHEKGMAWNDGETMAIERNLWDVHKSKTCYRGYHYTNGISFGNIDLYKPKILEFDGFKDTYKHIQKPKPPLGVTPKEIHELQRVQDLCRALYERSIFETVDSELMRKWSEELNDRLFNLELWKS